MCYDAFCNAESVSSRLRGMSFSDCKRRNDMFAGLLKLACFLMQFPCMYFDAFSDAKSVSSCSRGVSFPRVSASAASGKALGFRGTRWCVRWGCSGCAVLCSVASRYEASVCHHMLCCAAARYAVVAVICEGIVSDYSILCCFLFSAALHCAVLSIALRWFGVRVV